MDEANKWADLYKENGCPFGLALLVKDPKTYFWHSDRSNGDIYLDNTDTLLSHVLGYGGSNNFDDDDCLLVLKHLYRDILGYVGSNTLERLINIFRENILFQIDYASDKLKHNLVLHLEKYINTLLCMLSDKGLVDYGTCLSECWISDKGEWIVLNRQLCLDRIKELCLDRIKEVENEEDDNGITPQYSSACVDNLYPESFPAKKVDPD